MVYFMFISKHFKEIQNNQSWRNFSEKKTSSTLLQLTTPAATLTSVGDWQPLEMKKSHQRFLASFQAPELLGSVSPLPLESQNHSS